MHNQHPFLRYVHARTCTGIVLDLVDIITIFTLPDAVVFKSGVQSSQTCR